jgi:hypothetical protein
MPFEACLIDDALVEQMTKQLNEKLTDQLSGRRIHIRKRGAGLEAEVIYEAAFEMAAPAPEDICYDAVKSALAA